MQPKTYHLEEHRIPFKKIPKSVFYVIQKLRAKGFEAYLVGGSVRDLLLNVQPKDFDISTSAPPEEIKRIFKNCILIGKRFRLAHVRFGKKILEVATFRAGEETTELILRDNIWGTAEEDAKRRDFTINALFYDPENEIIIDYVDGFRDLEKRYLKSIGNPTIRFKQDPVRMIRLLKFVARFDFEVDIGAEKALEECKTEITKSSSARILEELLRMLESGASKKFFFLLYKSKILDLLLPEISKHLEEENAIYEYLDQIDTLVLKNFPQKLKRSLLLSSLIFPIVQKEIYLLALKKKKLDLGTIFERTKKKINSIFLPTFHLPRIPKIEMVAIITNQFRFTPFGEKRKKMRIPRNSFFGLSMEFFKIRCNIKPSLFKIYVKWNEAIFNLHKRKEK